MKLGARNAKHVSLDIARMLAFVHDSESGQARQIDIAKATGTRPQNVASQLHGPWRDCLIDWGPDGAILRRFRFIPADQLMEEQP